ncbi:MAG: CsgG/HfaB family protein [Fibrobacterota bacterium]
MLTSLAFAALTVVGLHAAKPSKSVKPVSAPAPATAPALTDPVAPAAPVATARKFVAVAPLASTSISRGEADLLGEALSTALQRRSGARMMERSQMEKILAEQGFQNSGACDKSDCAIQIGKILGIDQIVVGSVGKLGSSYMLNARLVDVATGEILGSTSRTSPARIEQVVAELPKAADDLFGTGETAPTPPPSAAATPAGPQSPSVTISGKEEETYSVDVQKDDPYDTRVLLRGNFAMGCFLPTSPLSLAYGVEGDLRVSKRFWLNAAYNQEIWGMYILDKTSLYTPYTQSTSSSYTDLPLATPGGDPSIFSVSFGGTYMVSQDEVKGPQSQVFSTQALFSQQIGNTNFTAYHAKYMDVPVTYERSIGLRGGVMLERHPILPDEGNGAFLLGEGLPNIHIVKTIGSVKSADTTNGWTNENNLMAYFGVSREYRQGSLIEFTRNDNGSKYQVAKFYHSAFYADAMINMVTILDEVSYSGKSYGVEHGDDPGQIATRLLGFRAGYTVQSGQLLGFPLSGELGWLPGSGSMYVRLNLGLGLRI